MIRRTRKRGAPAYTMIEMLVYIGVVAILLGAGYLAMYRCIDNSRALTRSADDISAALHAGEQWRRDVRGAAAVATNASGAFALRTSGKEITWRFESNCVMRATSSGSQIILANVKWSRMRLDPRKYVNAFSWEFEMLPHRKTAHNTNNGHPVFSVAAAVSEGGRQ